VAKYRYEDLDEASFQHLCQALFAHIFPTAQLPPTHQPDGGFDGFVRVAMDERKEFALQVKWVADVRQERDPAKWLDSIVKKEMPRLKEMAAAGTERWLLVTNVPGSAHPAVGRIDKLNSSLARYGRELGMELEAWWRNDLDRRIDKAPAELKLAFPDMLVGFDAMSALLDERFKNQRRTQLSRILRAAAATTWALDAEVRFKHAELEGVPLTDLFVDVPLCPPDERDVGNGTPLASSVATLTAAQGRRRMVVLGAPGQGKSTLLQYVAQSQRAVLLGKPFDAQPNGAANRIVMKVDLRDFARWVAGFDPFEFGESDKPKRRRGPKTLEAYLAKQLSVDSGGHDVSVADIAYVAEWLPMLVALDGLDEVADPAIRESVVKEIELFAERCEPNDVRTVITARPSFLGAAEPRRDRFEYWELLALNEARRMEYLDKWAKVRRITGRDLKELRRVFAARSAETHVAELARNPMQLALLLHLVNRRGDSIPTNRTSLYRDYMDSFLDREAVKDPRIASYRDLLQPVTAYLAWHLHAAAETDGGNGRLRLNELVSLIKHHLVDLDEDTSLAQDLFTAVTARVWAITSRQEGTFEFDVQPIREYFAARHLFDTAPPVSRPGRGVDKFARFRALLGRAYWINVARFMAGMFTPGELGSLADLLQDHIELSVHRGWSRDLAKILLLDGALDAAARARSRIWEAALDDLGVITHNGGAATYNTVPVVHGADHAIAYLQRTMAEQPADPLNHLRSRVIASFSTDRKTLLAWWATVLTTLSGETRDEWLRLLPILRLGQVLDEETITQVATSSPRGPESLLWARAPEPKTETTSRSLIEAVLAGKAPVVGGRSQAAELSTVTEPAYLQLKDNPNRTFLDERSREARIKQGDIALRHLGRSHDDGETLVRAIRTRGGKRGFTLAWSQVSNWVVRNYGRTWLANELAVVAAADRDLTLGTSSLRRDEAPFGPEGSPTALLTSMKGAVRDVNWWSKAHSDCRDELDLLCWTFGVVVAASREVVKAQLPRLAATLSALSADAIEVLCNATGRIEAIDGLERLDMGTLRAARDESPIAAALLLGRAQERDATFFLKDDISQLADIPDLLERVLRVLWVQHAAREPIGDNVLELFRIGGPKMTLAPTAPSFSEKQAVSVLDDAHAYPPAVVRAADDSLQTVMKSNKPLSEIATQDEWFVIQA